MSEELKNKIGHILNKAQNTTACHQKYVKLITEEYKNNPTEVFIEVFLNFVKLIIKKTDSVYVKRSLNFCSKFCCDVARKEEREEVYCLLPAVIKNVVEWTYADNYDMKYNSCRFIAMVLQDIGEDVQLDVNLCDEIQKAMLEKMKEAKVSLRLKAMSALIRLQDPMRYDCPVIAAFLAALNNGSANIRKEAVTHIAPHYLNFDKIIERVRDVDVSVRIAAFHKCADLSPNYFKIIQRHQILTSGFRETNDDVKRTFYEYLLPKWLTVYTGDFMKFVGALKLAADEEDLVKIQFLSLHLIKWFYNKHPINDLIAALPMNEEKVINVENLTTEVTLYWRILVGLLRESKDMDEYIDMIVPDMTHFCHYIEKIINVKSQETMDEWKNFEYQFDLFNLFEIGESYDYSDEVGRRTMDSLTTTVLQNQHFNTKLTKKIVAIAYKCSSSIEFFTNDMCQIISEIRESAVEAITEKPLTEDQQREKNYQIARLQLRINELEENRSEAVSNRDYDLAKIFHEQLSECRLEVERMRAEMAAHVRKARVVRDDNKIHCRCLDVLFGVLELAAVCRLTPSLITCRDQFLVPLLADAVAEETHWRALRALTLCAMVDRRTAEEYARVICVPMSSYRTIPINNVMALIQSIRGVTDLISVYGVEIMGAEEENNTTTSTENTTKRKLYNTEAEENLTNAKQDNFTISYIYKILLDMLDDERDEIRYAAASSITCLINQSYSITPSILTRLLLKLYNPITEKQDSDLQVRLSLLVDTFMKQKDSSNIMKEAIIPTLSSIADAPRTSPLADIDIENVLTFFAGVMNINLNKDDLKVLSLDICMKISENHNERVVPWLAKFLAQLDIVHDNTEIVGEIIDRIETLLKNLNDKRTKKFMEKCMSKLKGNPCRTVTANTLEETETNDGESGASTEQECEKNHEVLGEQSELRKPQHVKRRKQRNSKACVVLLEKLDIENRNRKNGNQTSTLESIIESSMENVQLDDDKMTIETVTSNSSSKSSQSSQSGHHNVITTETSDSDFSTENPTTRRSNRIRKKRIL